MLFRTVQLALLPQGDQHTWPDLFHGLASPSCSPS